MTIDVVLNCITAVSIRLASNVTRQYVVTNGRSSAIKLVVINAETR